MHEVWMVLKANGSWHASFVDEPDAAIAQATAIGGLIVRLGVVRDYRADPQVPPVPPVPVLPVPVEPVLGGDTETLRDKLRMGRPRAGAPGGGLAGL
jgi:hypothetical protein